MECPKCHKKISDSATVCPFCHKVLALTCPNCRTLNHSAVCSKCGYIILEKCSKCGKLTPTTQKKCNCGFSTATSIAYNECETDEFATLIIKFNALNRIRALLNSQELYAKFLVKLKNLITSQLKDIGAHVIVYGYTYTINFNKELSFATSVNKAIRLALKLVTAFSGLNVNLIEQLGTPLKMTITIMKKNAEELLINKSLESNVKLMIMKQQDKKYLRGMQVIIDQYCQDNTNDYKTDSLYSLEIDGLSVMFYEVLLENYIIPPNMEEDTPSDLTIAKATSIVKNEQMKTDIYAFNIFDINAMCQFEKCTIQKLASQLDYSKKILAIKCDKENGLKTSDIVKQYKSIGLKPIYIVCSEEMTYKPWGFFEKLFKEYYKLPVASGLTDKTFDAGRLNDFKQFLMGDIPKASTPEDARFAFMEQFIEFASILKDYVIIVDGFEHIDDTSIQALELYFNKFMKVLTNFIFITDNDTPVHSKIKGLLQTTLYKEITIVPCTIEDILSDIKEDATDFIKSFFFERIKESFNGSRLYFEHALRYLIDKDVLVIFEKKLLIKTNRSCMLPKDLHSLLRTRLKTFGKNQDASMILAYSVFLGERLDFSTLEALGINNIEENAKFLESTGFTYTYEKSIYINNYTYVSSVIQASLKKEVLELLVKTILSKLSKQLDNTTILLLMGRLSIFKEESLLLWKNSQISIQTGDYDAYLKNCLGYLSLIDKLDENISKESIENNKKEIYQNILMSLYSYSPAKIYSIEHVLLMDAIKEDDDDKIMKLSNLMLQGALITSNYTEAFPLLHNILVRMSHPSLMVKGAVNTKFLLLSLINIEILFNTGDCRSCIELADELLKAIRPNIINSIKPPNFSTNSFVSHLMDTFRMAAFAKLIANDSDIPEFCNSVKTALGEELPDKDCIFAIREYLAGKSFAPSNTENTTSFSKIIYLILHELTSVTDNYKQFAQNIYQAKLLASDLNQKQLEYICEILIGYAYAQAGIYVKADAILNDIKEKAESSAMFNILMMARYIIAKNKLNKGEADEALIIINDTLAVLQKRDNQAQVFYAMFERLFIEVSQEQKLPSININVEFRKLIQVSQNGELERIVKSNEYEPTDDEPEIALSDNDSYGYEEHPVEQTEEPQEEQYEEEPLESDIEETSEEIIELPEEEPVEEPEDDLAEMADSFEDDDSMGTETHE